MVISYFQSGLWGKHTSICRSNHLNAATEWGCFQAVFSLSIVKGNQDLHNGLRLAVFWCKVIYMHFIVWGSLSHPWSGHPMCTPQGGWYVRRVLYHSVSTAMTSAGITCDISKKSKFIHYLCFFPIPLCKLLFSDQSWLFHLHFITTPMFSSLRLHHLTDV